MYRSKRIKVYLDSHRTEIFVTFDGVRHEDEVYSIGHRQLERLHLALCGCNEVSCSAMGDLSHDTKGYTLNLEGECLILKKA